MVINETTAAFIVAHRHDDVRNLALRYSGATDVDLPFALDQIAGWQTACKKLPTWAAVDGIIYPPHLNMEQCSSEATAKYKASLCPTAPLLVDLTGGFGVDFSFMARRFERAVYVERSEMLCAIARNNFQRLGLDNVEVVCGDGVEYLRSMQSQSASLNMAMLPLIYIDPARRDTNGRKVFGISDCSPDVLAIKDELLAKAGSVMIKLSPMLDWHAAVKAFGGCCREVHIVSVGNECKELLLMLESNDIHPSRQPVIICVNDGQRFQALPSSDASVRLADGLEKKFLYVPNASVMKAGVYAQVTAAYPVVMVDKSSHLFLSDEDINGFPGRKFVILATTTMNKRELREKLGGISQANVSTRNFPLSAVELKKRLKLKDGGNIHLFATGFRGKHVIIIATTEAGMSGADV